MYPARCGAADAQRCVRHTTLLRIFSISFLLLAQEIQGIIQEKKILISIVSKMGLKKECEYDISCVQSILITNQSSSNVNYANPTIAAYL